MKLKTFIKRLEEIQKEHGPDIEVVCDTAFDLYYFSKKDVNIISTYASSDGEEFAVLIGPYYG